MAIKKKRKFSKENWLKLMKSVEASKAEPPPVPEKAEPKVEVHIHNNVPDFSSSGNAADNDLKRMTGDNHRRWMQ